MGAGIAACTEKGLDRATLYLQTKFTPLSGQDPASVPYDPAASLAGQVAQSIATSLRNLRTTWLDGLVLHSPLAVPGDMRQVWQAMEAIVDSGGARALGISNCYSLDQLRTLHASARIKPAIVQNRFYAGTGHDRELRAWCRSQGIVYQSFWTLTANAHVLEDARIAALARDHARTPAQVLFRYLTQEGVVPLTGPRDERHMRDDLAIFDFTLSEAERRAVGELFE